LPRSSTGPPRQPQVFRQDIETMAVFISIYLLFTP